MPAPGIVLDESDVGARPVTAAVLNKIGLVGHFNWGPVNTAVLVQSQRELDQQFGTTWETGLTGMLSGRGIYAQNGAAGVYVVRIAPSGVAAVKAAQTFSSKVTITALYPGTEGSVITVAIANGTSAGKKYTVTDSVLGVTEVWDNQTNTNSTTNTFANAGGPNEVGAGSDLVVFSYAADGDPRPPSQARRAPTGRLRWRTTWARSAAAPGAACTPWTPCTTCATSCARSRATRR
jgi:hypothetical protein